MMKRISYIVSMFCALVVSSYAQITFTTLANFSGSNGALPAYVSLVQGFDGNFYGTTLYGGPNCSLGTCGTVFKMTRVGVLTTVYTFCSKPNCVDGDLPYGGLVLGSEGDFYGTTYGGGSNGYGTVFKIGPVGTPTILESFCQPFTCNDGALPDEPLALGSDGNFYGTTLYGGGFADNGTVFKITPAGVLTTLYSFPPTPPAQSFPSQLIQATDGNFYGTTASGGTGCTGGCGTLFSITSSGTLTTLYSFCAEPNCTDGTHPESGVVQASDGNFYGTTSTGGELSGGGYGTFYRMTPKGVLTTLYSFCSLSNCADGAYPNPAVIQATDGNFYGTTAAGGGSAKCSSGCGTIYRITLDGLLTTLHSFDLTDGMSPIGGVSQGTDGSFYGTTNGGGLDSDGAIFNLSAGLAPFAQIVPEIGSTEQMIHVLGQGLKSTTSVSFNGTPATFTVKSDTLLTTTVPAGATTGFVTVTTPNSTLTSNKEFRVIP
jgi:uncharacterized repeat protein (TIGR03803 family)